MTYEPKYSDEQFADAMRQAVAERGESFVYPNEWRGGGVRDGACAYYKPNVGGACIVGKALEILGEDVSKLDNRGANSVLQRGGLTSPRVAWAASRAQQSQDGHDSWGDALEEYLYIYSVGTELVVVRDA